MWAPGQSGNPKGRAKGAPTKITQLRDEIGKGINDVIGAMMAQAMAGDVAAARLLVERVLPPVRTSDLAITIPLTDDLAESGREVLRAVGLGELNPDQGQRLLMALGTQAKILETSELMRRIELLEQKANGDTA